MRTGTDACFVRIGDGTVSLSDANSVGKGSPVLIHSFQSMNQISVTGGACIFRAGVACKWDYRAAGTRKNLLGWFVQFYEVESGQIRRSHAVFLGQSDIGDVLGRESKQGRPERVAQHAVPSGEHPAGFHRISPFLEIQISTDAVRNDKVGVSDSVERCDRFHQAKGVEHSFAAIRKASFHVFQCAGHPRLAVSFQYGKADQKTWLQYRSADFHRDTLAFHRLVRIVFHVEKRDAIHTADGVVAIGFKSFLRAGADPCALCDEQVGEAMCLEIFDDGYDDFRMSGRTAVRRCGNDEIWFQDDARFLFRNHSTQIDGLKKFRGHFLGIVSVDHGDGGVLHALKYRKEA